MQEISFKLRRQGLVLALVFSVYAQEMELQELLVSAKLVRR